MFQCTTSLTVMLIYMTPLGGFKMYHFWEGRQCFLAGCPTARTTVWTSPARQRWGPLCVLWSEESLTWTGCVFSCCTNSKWSGKPRLYHKAWWQQCCHPTWSWQCRSGRTRQTSRQPSAGHSHSPSLTNRLNLTMWKQECNSERCSSASGGSVFMLVLLHSRWHVYVNFPAVSVFLARRFFVRQEPSDLQRNMITTDFLQVSPCPRKFCK